MIVALWGASATAKTTVAERVAARLGVPLRSCGEEIRRAAQKAVVSLAEAPEALHRSVDDATRDWVRYHALKGAVLEGRFLDQVLAEEPGVVLVRVTCESSVRVQRWVDRAGSAFEKDNLAEHDKADDLFRLRMYDSADKGAALFTLDTSSGGVDKWTEELLGLIQESRTPPRD
jgi:cytidylate kinase